MNIKSVGKTLIVALIFAVAVALPLMHSQQAVASDPIASACASDQQAAFAQFAASSSGWTMDECAVAGPYALIGFRSSDTGDTGLLTQDSGGQWNLVTRGGGQILASDMLLDVPSMPVDTAQSLESVATSQNP